MYSFGMKLLVSLDQLLNVLTGGEEDNTLSSRAYIRSLSSKKWMYIKKFIDNLFFFDDQHCKEAFFVEYNKRQEWINKYKYIKELN